MRITVLYNEDNGCDYHRLLNPLKYLKVNELDKIIFIKYKDAQAIPSVFDCDILLYSRQFFGNLEKLNKLREKYGFKIVVDFDDSYKLYNSHILYKASQEFNNTKTLKDNCTNADYVFVTNEQVREVYKDFNPNIEIIPNALPIGQAPFIPSKSEEEIKRFLYVSGVTHYDDLKTIGGLFKRLSSDGDFKRKAKFVLCGYNNNTEKRNTWNKMESLCRINGAYERRNSIPLDSYIEHYNYGDISIAPLADNEFNKCKSNLKFIEAGCMKHPFICANMLPYTVDKQLENKGIKFCSKVSEWYEAFRFFLKNPSAIQDYGEINHEYVKDNYDLLKINKKREDIFNFLTNSL